MPSGTPIFDISFQTGDHGDGSSFNGPGGVLAHAFFPSNSALGGDTHYDDDDVFTFNTSSGKFKLNDRIESGKTMYLSLHGESGITILIFVLGVNFLYVSIHEFGHALGLGHTDVEGAVMEPVINPYDPDQQLHEDDILGIQELYGKYQVNTKLRINK